MKFFTKRKFPAPLYSYGGYSSTSLKEMGCCAAVEARIIDSNDPTLKKFIGAALDDKRTLLFFFIVPIYSSNVAIENAILKLPSHTYTKLPEFTNPRSGHKVRTYIINLKAKA